MQLILYSSTLISSLIFFKINHPLAMGFMLLIQTLQICLLTGMMSKSFWFSYILFLIFLGGMLVLFIYVTSLASNEMFSLSMKLTTICLIYLFMFMIMMLFLDKSYFSFFLENNEMTKMNNMNLFTEENSLNLYKLYNYPTNLITIMLMNYLLITLIAVVKITKLFYGPLRLMN
uniref:NADH dehydrogenase subunit 6 n=1 Tax=Rhagoletis cerasi TaxID=43399 RepID=UPI001F129CED|nr:NADH dehydrogenase subunit 6 [Rhagoletis cerasi]UMI33254.1 NADH dehydrogenase subunit 6 [Rhagoletis cerasi]UMI33267.1 NADH dehydrogenase subunit 6 [Rhagoletis cerasi]UMI33280.1 NADH dehydrogenase subunit 6 [Rhagoletis cerasi]